MEYNGSSNSFSSVSHEARLEECDENIAQLWSPHLFDSGLCYGLAEVYIHIHCSSCSSSELALRQELALIGRLSNHVISMTTHHSLSLRDS